MTSSSIRWSEDPTLVHVDTPREGIPPLTTGPAYRPALARLRRGSGPVAVDVERAMGIRYSARAYLIQLRREGSGTLLCDPVGNEEYYPELAAILGDAVWILHAADQDLPSLGDLGLRPGPGKLFDTEVAALLLGDERISLQAQLAENLGLLLAKEHSQADWSERPLADELRSYAALDVELLAPLRHVQLERLERAGRLEWAAQEFEEIRTRPPKAAPAEPWRRATHRQDFSSRRDLALVRALWQARDRIAQTIDTAPDLVLSRADIAALARRRPRSLADVRTARPLRSGGKQYLAPALWQAVAQAWALPSSELPEPAPARPSRRAERGIPHLLDHVRSAVQERAAELGIRHDVLLKPAVQRELARLLRRRVARTGPAIGDAMAELGARPWQVENTAAWIAAAVRS